MINIGGDLLTSFRHIQSQQVPEGGGDAHVHALDLEVSSDVCVHQFTYNGRSSAVLCWLPVTKRLTVPLQTNSIPAILEPMHATSANFHNSDSSTEPLKFCQ